MEKVLHFYRSPGLSVNSTSVLVSKIKTLYPAVNIEVATELCFNVGVTNVISDYKLEQLTWLLSECFKQKKLTETSWLTVPENSFLIEVGPRLNFATAFSTNAVSICQDIGLIDIHRIEVSRRYLFTVCDTIADKELLHIRKKISGLLFDKMTEVEYNDTLQAFHIDIKTEEIYDIDILGIGRTALEKANIELGLAFDDWDLDFYTKLFTEQIKRNPTNVECFDLAQSNSEHSRHWFFKGRMIVNGKEKKKCLMELVCDTQNTTNKNNVIKFSDNSR